MALAVSDAERQPRSDKVRTRLNVVPTMKIGHVHVHQESLTKSGKRAAVFASKASRSGAEQQRCPLILGSFRAGSSEVRNNCP
jgi:hypothetical protein